MKSLIKSIHIYIILIFIVQFSIAQNSKPREIKGIKSLGNGEKATFTVIQQGETFQIFNKSNTLMINESRFEEMLGYINNNPILFYERPRLDSMVYRIIAPFFMDFKSDKYTDDISTFEINLISGMNGKVVEITFSVNKNAKIPFNALEKLEKEILAANFKLDFDPNHSLFKGSTWVYTWCIYSVEGIKNRLKEKKN